MEFIGGWSFWAIVAKELVPSLLGAVPPGLRHCDGLSAHSSRYLPWLSNGPMPGCWALAAERPPLVPHPVRRNAIPHEAEIQDTVFMLKA